MKPATKITILLLLLSLTAATKKRDPLTEAEADQLREVALEPYKRIKLLIKFTEARLTSIDQIRADPKLAADRGKQVHDLLEDLTALLDEINANLDTYAGEKMEKNTHKEFIKGLREVMQSCQSWDVKLKALKAGDQADAQARREFQDYMFVLQDTEDALASTADIARQYAEESDADKPKKK